MAPQALKFWAIRKIVSISRINVFEAAKKWNQSAQNQNMRSQAESRNFYDEELPTVDEIDQIDQNYGDIFVTTGKFCGNWTSHRNLDNFDSSVLVSTVITHYFVTWKIIYTTIKI